MLPDTVCVFFDLQDNPIDTPRGFFEALDRRIREQTQQGRRLELPTLPEGPTFESASQWFGLLEEYTGERRILICIDEFERLEDLFPGERRELLQLMGLFRATIQHRRKLRLLVAGAAPFEDLDALWNDHFINLREIRIGHLGRDTAIDLLTQPISDFPAEAIPQTVAELIWTRTGGQPYLLQLYGSLLVTHLNDQKRYTATLEDVTSVEDDALSQGTYYFRDTYNKAPAAARSILEQIACGQTSHHDDPRALRWLKRRYLVSEEGKLGIPVLGAWIREEILV